MHDVNKENKKVNKNRNLLLYNYHKATINECDEAEYVNSMEYNESYLSDKYKELFNK